MKRLFSSSSLDTPTISSVVSTAPTVKVRESPTFKFSVVCKKSEIITPSFNKVLLVMSSFISNFSELSLLIP